MRQTTRLYENGLIKVTYFQTPIDTKRIENCIKSERGSGDVIQSAIASCKRAKNKFLDYVIANDWTHWGMITYNQQKCKIDRENLKEVQEVTTKRLNNIKQRYDKSLKYLLVFEPHHHGGWHAHIFIYTENYDTFSKARHYKTNRLIKDKQKRQVFNWNLWTKSVGYATFVDISHTNQSLVEKLKLSQYVTKYVTKNIGLGMEQFNKKKYWCSKGLKLPQITDELPFGVLEQYNQIYKKDFLITSDLTREPIQNITITFYNSHEPKSIT